MTKTAFEAISGSGPVVFLCDHAANMLPSGLLGLSPALLSTHIAYDIGAATLTRTLARAYGAPAFLGCWSRLLIDLNRGIDDPTLVMRLSDASIIPGNRNVDEAEVARRIKAFYEPYHQAIDECLDQIGNEAILVSMHSFTPVWKGHPRAWQVGVLYDRDVRLATPLMARLAQAGFTVGDNEPYSGALEGDTLWRHGTMRGLAHVLIEIRQDLIGSDNDAHAFGLQLKPILDAAISDMHSQGGKCALHQPRPAG